MSDLPNRLRNVPAIVEMHMEHPWSTMLEAADRIEELEKLLYQLTDDDPCQFDHHGYCQAHDWFDSEEKCPNKRAQEILS